jgi:calcium-dependent protein kinase
MGQGLKKKKNVTQELESVRLRVEDRVGKLQVTGRYHQLPKKVADDFSFSSQELGTGANGAVYLATHKIDGTRVAVKPYNTTRITKQEMRVLRNEVEIFLSLDHPHVCRLVGVYEDMEVIQVVMECCEGGEILSYIQRRGHFTEKDAANLAYQMFLSVAYIHDQDIVHRDIKLQNFLFEDKEYKHVKLIDFGFSRYWTTNKKMKLGCGTLSYMAPELLDGEYTNKCDIWSLGVCVYLLLIGILPFGEGPEAEVEEKIKKGAYNTSTPMWSVISESARDFLVKLLEVNEMKRLSAEDALAHSWIAQREQVDAPGEGFNQSIVNSLTAFAEASQFRKAAMTMMAYSLTAEERQDVRQAFMELDKDQTGTIGLNELKEVLSSKALIKEPDAAKIFNSMTTTQNDRVNYSDFLAAMLASRIELNQKHLRSAFNRFDRDGSGEISIEDLREVLGDQHNGVKVEDLLTQADLDHSGKISFEEFSSFLQADGDMDAQRELADAVIEREHKRLNIATRQDDIPEALSPKLEVPGNPFVEIPGSVKDSSSLAAPEASQSENKASVISAACTSANSLDGQRGSVLQEPDHKQSEAAAPKPEPLPPSKNESKCCTIA